MAGCMPEWVQSKRFYSTEAAKVTWTIDPLDQYLQDQDNCEYLTKEL